MERFSGIFGIIFILICAYLMSNNRKAINKRVVLTGLTLQVLLAVFILKVPLGQKLFSFIGLGISQLLDFSHEGALFVFGVLVKKEVLDTVFGPGNSFIFIFSLLPTIIFVCVLISIAYHFGIMQRVVSVIARFVHWFMHVSGSEALSNVASAFVGQVEAQIMIKPYLNKMTRSELLASMTGSMACISGGIMAVYISMGIPAAYLLAASLMAAPGALVIAKIVYPETEKSETSGYVALDVKKEHINVLDAISKGASDGWQVSVNVIAMLIGVIALITMIDAFVSWLGYLVTLTGFGIDGFDLRSLKLGDIFGVLFSGIAWLMGVPWKDANTVGSLMGTKMVINEFVAYSNLIPLIKSGAISTKAIIIASFALCGFANFSSIAIQVGGIGVLAPSRRADLATLGFKALICGTMASFISAALAGMIL